MESKKESMNIEKPESAPNAKLIASGVTSADIDWDRIETEQDDNHRVFFTSKSTATGKTYEYSIEQVKAIQHWTDVDQKARSDLDAFKEKGRQHLKHAYCPRCNEKLKGGVPSCRCGANFCEYCFTLANGDRYTCDCRDIESQFYQAMNDATNEIMKRREQEYQDWINGVREGRKDRDPDKDDK